MKKFAIIVIFLAIWLVSNGPVGVEAEAGDQIPGECLRKLTLNESVNVIAYSWRSESDKAPKSEQCSDFD